MQSSAPKLFQIHKTNLPGCYEIQLIVFDYEKNAYTQNTTDKVVAA